MLIAAVDGGRLCQPVVLATVVASSPPCLSTPVLCVSLFPVLCETGKEKSNPSTPNRLIKMVSDCNWWTYGVISGFQRCSFFIVAYILSCSKGRGKEALCIKSLRECRRIWREGIFWAKQEKAAFILLPNEGWKMDSAKKMRLKRILHDIPKEAMYDHHAYLKQKNEIHDKRQLGREVFYLKLLQIRKTERDPENPCLRDYWSQRT